MAPSIMAEQQTVTVTNESINGPVVELLDRIGVGAYRLSRDGELLATNSCLALLLAVDPEAAADLQSGPARDFEREHQWTTSRGAKVRVQDVRRAVHDDKGELIGFEGVVTALGQASSYPALESRMAQMLPEGGALLWLEATRFRDVTELLGPRTAEELLNEFETRLLSAMPKGAVLAHTALSTLIASPPV